MYEKVEHVVYNFVSCELSVFISEIMEWFSITYSMVFLLRSYFLVFQLLTFRVQHMYNIIVVCELL